MRILSICFVLTASIASAEVTDDDFAVPESPAFQLIDVSPSAILRPTTVKGLTVAASNFTGEGLSLSIPKELGVEFAPFRILWAEKNGDMSTKDIVEAGPTLSAQTLKNLTHIRPRIAPFLYRLRVSVAAKRDTSVGGADGQPAHLALGLRLNFLDNADPRTNKSRGLPDENWNKAVLELAGAIRTKTERISPSETLTFQDNAAFWVTAGVPIRSKSLNDRLKLRLKGQALVGYRVIGIKAGPDAEFKLDHHLSTRIYVGSNEHKAYAEFQGAEINNKREYFYSMGLEARTKGVWLVASVGGQGGLGNIENQTTSFSLKFDPSSLLKGKKDSEKCTGKSK